VSGTIDRGPHWAYPARENKRRTTFHFAARPRGREGGLQCCGAQQHGRCRSSGNGQPGAGELHPAAHRLSLFLSTGAERGRSREDGSMRVNCSRPVGVITSIEGVYKPELRVRCVLVFYALPDGQRLPRAAIEKEIRQRRHQIGSALAHALQRYVEIKDAPIHGTCPVPEFEEHYAALCNLLRAFGAVAAKPEEWAESIITVWEKALVDSEPEEEDLEHPLGRLFFPLLGDTVEDSSFRKENVTRNGKQGTLFVTECGQLLTMLQKQSPRDWHLPKSPQGLSRRLHSARFSAFEIWDAESAPDLQLLRRTARSRPIGFFFANDG